MTMHFLSKKYDCIATKQLITSFEKMGVKFYQWHMAINESMGVSRRNLKLLLMIMSLNILYKADL